MSMIDLPESLLEAVSDTELIDYDQSLNLTSLDSSPYPIVIGKETPVEAIIELLSNTRFEHFVQEDHGHFFYNLILAAIMQKHSKTISTKPLRSVLTTGYSSMRRMVLPFNCSLDKKSILKHLEVYLERHKLSAISEGVLTIASEFILNALFHAPVDSANQRLFSKLARHEYVELPDEQNANIFIGHNQTTFVIGCQDPFGSVDKEIVFKLLNRAYGQTKAEINTGQSFGLGLKSAIDNSSGLYLLVEKSKKTTIYCTFPTEAGMRKVISMSKNIHIKFY